MKMKKYETAYVCECYDNFDSHKMDTLSEDKWGEVNDYTHIIEKKTGYPVYIMLPNHTVSPKQHIIMKTDEYWLVSGGKDEDTMKNIYVLRVGEDILRILFTDSIVDNKGISQRVTVCGIREGETGKDTTYWGVTIQNPRDADNTYRARQVAFRKAFVNFVQKRGRLNLTDDGSNLRDYPAINALYDKLRFDLYWQGAWEGK
jgi:hypothetical protein